MSLDTLKTGGNARTASGSGAPSVLKTSPERYISLGDLIDPTKPDNRDLLVRAYGDQGITGFLELTGAKKNAGTSDEVQWWEEGRLHSTITATVAVVSGSIGTLTASAGALRLNDVLLTPAGQRLVVMKDTNTASNVKTMDGENVLAISSGTKLAIIGNIYAQGTNQPSKFYQTALKKYINPFIITKEVFTVNGSQATNIGWINVNGDYRWYLKNEMDTRKRFLNQREMMLLFGQSVVAPNGGTYNATLDISVPNGSSTATEGTTGSEGYFQAVERRGIVADSTEGKTFSTLGDIDSIILELDKEGAPSEYAMYVNRATSLEIDDLLANGIASSNLTAGLPGQFGAFNNNPDMAVQLGFKSFTRGGYTFHKHDWKLLNDPTLGALSGYYKGAMVPLCQVADAKTGEKCPALEMNYKAAGNYSREMEHWVTGGGVLGYKTDGEDVARFNYRSECNLVVRAANQHVALT
jgi:hypothetical protein